MLLNGRLMGRCVGVAVVVVINRALVLPCMVKQMLICSHCVKVKKKKTTTEEEREREELLCKELRDEERRRRRRGERGVICWRSVYSQGRRMG